MNGNQYRDGVPLQPNSKGLIALTNEVPLHHRAAEEPAQGSKQSAHLHIGPSFLW